MGDDSPDQAHVVRSLRVDALPRQQQLHRIGPVDSLREAYRRHNGRDSEHHLRETEFSPIARQDEVTPGGKGEPVTQAVAVHGGDDGLEDLPSALEGIERRLLPECPGELTHRTGSVAQIPAGAEGPPRPGDDCHPRVLIVTKARKRIVEVTPHLGVDCVERSGSVVGDGGHVAIKPERDCVAHRAPVCLVRRHAAVACRGPADGSDKPYATG